MKIQKIQKFKNNQEKILFIISNKLKKEVLIFKNKHLLDEIYPITESLINRLRFSPG